MADQTVREVVVLFDTGNEVVYEGEEAERVWARRDELFSTVLEYPLGRVVAVSRREE